MTRRDLAVVRPWFEDEDVQRFLGGPEWPARMLTLAETVAGTIFRGATQTASYRWIALDGAHPVGYIDCGITDRWTVCDDDGTGAPVVVSAIDVPAASVALTVDPSRRGAGIGRSMVRALLAAPEVRSVELFGAGVDPDNVASLRCFGAVGFVLQTSEPDWEGMLYLIRERERRFRRGNHAHTCP